jgi:DNA-binding XRE family transcriptional regulator
MNAVLKPVVGVGQDSVGENNGALAYKAPKKVTLYPNLGLHHVEKKDMLTAAQLRAARGLLDWTRSDLAKAANISPETIKNIEHGTFRPQENTADAILKAFAAHDVQFLENEGVKKAPTLLTSYEGQADFRRYIDDFYAKISALCTSNEPVTVCAAGVDDRLFMNALGDYSKQHAERMAKFKNLKFRSLVSEKEAALFPGYIDYRLVTDMPMTVLFGIYGQYFDLTIHGTGPALPKVVVIKSDIVVNAYKSQFEAMWNTAKRI